MVALKNHKFFDLFPLGESRGIIGSARVNQYTDNEIVFDEGDLANSIYLVLDGEIEISGRTPDGNYDYIHTFRADDFFGEFSAIDGKGRSARAEVVKSATLAEIEQDIFLAHLMTAPSESALGFCQHVLSHVRSHHKHCFDEMVRYHKMQLLGELSKSIMHDIRSPLLVIKSSMELMRESNPTEDTYELCELINVQLRRVQDMASEVLDFSKGNSQLNLRSVELQSLLSYFEMLNKDYYGRRGINLIINSEKIELMLDTEKFIRVLQNLCNNAAESMSEGQIELKAEIEDHNVLLTIADNGPGMSEEIKQSIFEPFVTAGKQNGTGLGTVIAKSLIESHGGTISLESDSNGTRFFIRLPMIV